MWLKFNPGMPCTQFPTTETRWPPRRWKEFRRSCKILDLFWKWKWSLPDSTSPSCTQWGRTLTPKGLDAGCRLLFLVCHTSSSWLSPNIIVIWFLHFFYINNIFNRFKPPISYHIRPVFLQERGQKRATRYNPRKWKCLKNHPVNFAQLQIVLQDLPWHFIS